jgi:GTPase SAR1 family protein
VPRYDELRAAALEQFDPVIAAARRADVAEALRRLLAAKDRLAESQLSVVVCGEFSRGKSTLLNALLEQEDELFPTGVSFTTSLIMTVSYGIEERITVRLGSTEDAEPGGDCGPASAGPIREATVSRAELRDYVTQDGNPGNGKRVLSVSIELPSKLLASGLALVDTPGIGGVYTEHTAVTNAVLPLADAIIFVADVHQPLTGSELGFLKRSIDTAGVGDDRDALICVLTKIDQVTEYDDTVSRTRAKLAEATGWPRVPVVPVSSTAKIAYLTSRDDIDLDDSNFPVLEQVLWDALARRRARAILASALADLDGSAAALLEPIQAELSVLRAAGPEAAAGLRAALNDRRMSLAGLGIAAASWRGDLVRKSADMARDVLKRVLEDADRTWQNVPGYLADDALAAETDKLLRRVDEDLCMITSIADRMLYDRAAQLQRQLAGDLGLTLGSAAIRRLPAAPVPTVREAGIPGSSAGRPRGSLPELKPSPLISISNGVGSVLGRIVEIFVAPGAGSLVGGAIGGAGGMVAAGALRLARWRISGSAARRQPLGVVRQQLRADLDEFYQQVFLPHVTAHVGAVTDEWAALIAAEIDSRILQQQASMAESARRLDEPTEEDAERAAAREAALLAAQEPLAKVRRRVGELAWATEELRARGES